MIRNRLQRLRQRRAFLVNVAQFRPISLPAIGGGMAWYDTTDTAYMFRDSAGTTPVTAVGQSVGMLKDKSGNGLHLTQPTQANAGTLRVDARGRYYIQFTASQCMFSAATFTQNTPCWMIAAFSVVGTAGGSLIFGCRSASNQSCGIFSNPNYSMTCGVFDPTLGVQTVSGANASVSQNVVTVVDIVVAAGTNATATNGGTAFTGTTSVPVNFSVSGQRIGINTGVSGNTPSNLNAVNFFGGIIYNAAPTTPQQSNTAAFLKNLCGIGALEGQTYDVFAFGGQSNCMGKGTYSTSTTPAYGTAIEFQDGFIRPLVDPTRHYATNSAGSVSATGSLLPSFATAYYAATGRKVCVVGGGASGVGLTVAPGWETTSVYRDALAAKTAAAVALIQAHGGTATVKGVIWQQGETDAISGISTATHQAALVTLHGHLQTLFGIPALKMFCLQIDRDSTSTDDAKFLLIRNAIAGFCAAEPNAYLVMAYQDFYGQGHLGDGILHWDQYALNLAGQLAGAAVAVVLP